MGNAKDVLKGSKAGEAKYILIQVLLVYLRLIDGENYTRCKMNRVVYEYEYVQAKRIQCKLQYYVYVYVLVLVYVCVCTRTRTRMRMCMYL